MPYHKNKIVTDNFVANIGFVDRVTLGKMTGAQSRRMPVIKINQTGEMVGAYSSAREAASKKQRSDRMNKEVMFSSATNEWATPQDFYDELNKEFGFTLDPCATPENAKCKKYYTVLDDGLKQDWKGETVFCNPPYGRAIKDWVKKCHEESKKENTTVVMLMPARTDTAYFHDYIYYNAKQIRFIRGRLKFGNSKNSAPFPSMVVVF